MHQLKRSEAGNWTVWKATRAIGEVRRVKQNPAYGRGSGPVSDGVMVWGGFIGDNRIGMDFRTRRAAAEAVERAHNRLVTS